MFCPVFCPKFGVWNSDDEWLVADEWLEGVGLPGIPGTPKLGVLWPVGTVLKFGAPKPSALSFDL